MAAKFDVDEVLRQVFDDDCDRYSDEDEEGDEDVCEPENVGVEKEKLEKLETLIDSFDGGEGFNAQLFRENAKKALLPILCQAFSSLQVTGIKEKGM